jgi:sugar phosphate permease
MWLVNSLAYTITWGAAVQVIGVAFDETERPAQLTKAASASRFGASLGSMMFGTLLKAGLTWRQALMPAVPIQILIGLGCLYCWSAMPKSNSEAVAKKPSADGKEATDKKKKAEAAPSGLTAFASFDLWLMLIPKVVLFTYTQFFMNFVSSLLKKSYGFSDGDATFMQGVTQGGSVIGLLVLGNMVYKTLSPPRQVLLVAAELLVCTAVPLLLALQQGSSLPDPVSALISPLVVPLLTLWGCAYALPFYLPPGEFAIKIGGKSAAAFFTNLFDAAGFTLCMFWNPWASKASKDGDFTIVLLSMSAFGALALLTMPLCMHRMQAAGSEEKKRA